MTDKNELEERVLGDCNKQNVIFGVVSLFFGRRLDFALIFNHPVSAIHTHTKKCAHYTCVQNKKLGDFIER